MPMNVAITIKDAPPGVDAQALGDALSQVIRGISGGDVQVIVSDQDSPNAFSRLNVYSQLGKGITVE